MILAIDVYYYSTKAKAVGVIFEKWNDSRPKEIKSVYLSDIQQYESDNFYKRELPCIISLLQKIDLSKIEIIIVDSFVYLDDNKKLGLRGYLHEYLEGNMPILGVAKNSFHLNKKNVIEVYRGDSKKPLYISSIGQDLELSAELVRNMHGNYRFPTILKILDQETRDIKKNKM
ncbi:endonuclease V [uncultured Aquimarina sp.]|uniref:endonuclease V n=1 Tax=uncultured Aquimarina sp. TaxID=575652 RepID=UPI00262C8A56|nr:endonuclease V [uncultured Aquimarina sp.]